MASRHHISPAITVQVRPARWLLGAASAVWLLGVLAWVYGLLQGLGQTWGYLALVGVYVLGLLGLYRWWGQQTTGQLQWQHGQWSWQAAGQAALPLQGAAVVVLDMQSTMLLLFPRQSPRLWLSVGQAHQPANWGDVRRAVYSQVFVAQP